jgi:PAS domain S-box-containing protein
VKANAVREKMKSRRQSAQKEGKRGRRISDSQKNNTTSEESLRLAFESAPIGMAIVDADYRLQRVNRSLCETLGYDATELLQRKFVDLTHPDDIGKDTMLVRKLFRGKLPSYRLEKRFITKEGALVWLDVTTVAIREQKREPLLGFVMMEDITESKRAQEALRTSEESYRSFVVNSSEGIWRFELEEPVDTSLPIDNQVNFLYRHGYLAECNDALARMYGRDRADDLVGARLGDFGVASQPATPVSLRKLIASNYRLRNVRTEKTNADGARRYFSSSLIGIVVNDMLLRVWGVQTDETDQRMAELSLARSHEQLRVLSAHLLSLREKEKTDLARQLHDTLGQSLTSIKIDLSLLRKNLKSKDKSSTAATVNKLSEITALLSQAISTVKTLSTELRPGVLDKFGLRAAMEWQSREFSRRFGIECSFRASRNLAPITPEISIGLFRILQEALTNVAMHSQASRVKVHLTPDKSTLSLTVSDNGRGITIEETNSPTSLGLLGMRERAETLDGKLSIQGRLGRTQVRVQIPLAVKSHKRPETTND